MTEDTIYRRRWWTLGVLGLSLLLISLDNTIVNVALPSIAGDLHASTSDLQWVVDSYTLVFAALLLTAGSVGDHFGRRRALTIGIVVFGGGSVLSALAGSPGELIATRALMGVGGAFIMPSTLSILTRVFPEEERARAIGIWAAIAGLGIAIGPVAGGALLESFSWGSVFLVNVPFVFLALALGRVLIPESKDPEASPLEFGGAALSFAGLAALLWGIIEAPSRGWTDPAILGSFALALVLLVAFVVWELRSKAPMLDMRLFRNRRFSAASAAIALTFFALFGTVFFLTQYLQEVLGYGAFEAGVRILPVSFGMVFASTQTANRVAHVGSKRVVSAGFALVAAGLFMLSFADGGTDYAFLAVALFVLGAGMGTAMTPATDSVMGALPAAKAGVGSAMNDTTREVGGALGVAVLGSLLSTGYRGHMGDATRHLPAAAAHAAHDSIAGAHQAAAHLGAAGRALSDAAEHAFVSGMSSTVTVAAAVAAFGALVALRFLPARAEEPVATPTTVS